MKIKKHFFSAFFLIYLNLFFVANAKEIDSKKSISSENQLDSDSLITKFGTLTFTDLKGTPGPLAEKIILNGKDFLLPNPKKDVYGSSISLIPGDFGYGLNGIEYEKKKVGKNTKFITKRLVILEGPDGNCIRHLVVLDFTGDKPYISENFGYNPKGDSCLTFLRAKWGKNKSYIYLDGPFTYIYKTGDKIIGPID